MTVLLTGAAGFIGYHVALALINKGIEVIGVDNINEYYNPKLKLDRLEQIKIIDRRGLFSFKKLDITDKRAVSEVFSKSKIRRVVHLAAQAGVRYSLTNPEAYIESNIVGYLNILQSSRICGVQHLLYASSSSVYGLNRKLPFSEQDHTDHPVSLYAATKKANEMMAHSYSHLFNLPTTGLRFFTVYGPWGRPDMAMYIFANALVDKKPIKLFGQGDLLRDFTYVDDIVESITRLLDLPPTPDSRWNNEVVDPGTSSAPYKVFNIGNHQPVKVLDVVKIMAEILNVEPIIELCQMQPGDVPTTFADIDRLNSVTSFQPSTPIAVGVKKFINWFIEYRQSPKI